jgi:hypothetical protein
VAKKSSVLLLVILAPAILSASAQVLDQVPGGSEPDLKTPLVRSALTCSQTTTIAGPMALAERARLKAQLVALLRESLYDDANGIVNIAREKEIKKLANKLSSG